MSSPLNTCLKDTDIYSQAKMETINDIMYNIGKYQVILGNLIIEEGNQINQSIKDNITKLNFFPVEYYEYIPEFTLNTIISTLFLAIIFGIITLYRNSGTSDNTKLSSNIVRKKNINNKPIIKKFGLYLESVKELNDASKNIVSSFEKGQTYWVLVRVKMVDYINMAGTKFELHRNNIHPKTTNTKSAFQTKDLYLILNFKIINNIWNYNSL